MEAVSPMTDEQRRDLELLAEAMIPADAIDEGLRDAGFAGIIDLRNTYQPLLASLYDVGLRGTHETCLALFGRPLAELQTGERQEVLRALAGGEVWGSSWTETLSPGEFFANLRADVCFVYCTSEEVWTRIGFPGPSFDQGGYPDFADPQPQD